MRYDFFVYSLGNILICPDCGIERIEKIKKLGFNIVTRTYSQDTCFVCDMGVY